MVHKRRDPKKGASWRRIIGRQAHSGVTVRAWCLDRQLSEATFHWWRRELARRDGERKTSTRTGELKRSTRPHPRDGGKQRTLPAMTSPALVPVRVAQDDLQAGGGSIEIALPDGRCIRVRGPVDRQTLTDVLTVMRSSPCRAEGSVAVATRKPRRNEEREYRISMEIVVDAHDSDERAMGWYYYLEDELQFPFTASCIAKRAISPLRIEDDVEVIGMTDEDECAREMFVTIRWEKDGLAVPLSQLEPIGDTDEQTRRAIEDWHYWIGMGYEF